VSDDLDAFFGQQQRRLREQLDLDAESEFYGRGTDPALMDGDSDAVVRRAYTRRETLPIPYNRSHRRRRGL
jgi:hypothetical protein